ncbi:hypothetical protein [Bowmanella yangjiangensis]|uniref:Uncharacterized protein n=1 Tax=Bowmanella yangjiangensis TaxID=2811230 RepID=A0ABS3CYX8_9ALTE|nr:hypothetical protein [Bowmanella yangjiangensis]MBN7821545.1 hypothetical protein [Bowmanella yangjiangensis]
MYTPEFFRSHFLNNECFNETGGSFNSVVKEFCEKLTPREKNNSIGIDFREFIDCKKECEFLDDEVAGVIIES